MTEDEFRQKYPYSTDEQVRLYAEAVAADQNKPASVEPDIPMAMITVPAPREFREELRDFRGETREATTYSAGVRWFGHLDDVPPEAAPVDHTVEMRAILLGRHGFSLGLSTEMRQRLETTDMTDEEMLAMLVGAPSAREFADLA